MPPSTPLSLLRTGPSSAAMLLSAALAAFAQTGQVASPGPLSKAHAALDGAGKCQSCHGADRKVAPDRCLSCHQPIADRIRLKKGVHRAVTGACADCHVGARWRRCRPQASRSGGLRSRRRDRVRPEGASRDGRGEGLRVVPHVALVSDRLTRLRHLPHRPARGQARHGVRNLPHARGMGQCIASVPQDRPVQPRRPAPRCAVRKLPHQRRGEGHADEVLRLPLGAAPGRSVSDPAGRDCENVPPPDQLDAR